MKVKSDIEIAREAKLTKIIIINSENDFGKFDITFSSLLILSC